MPTQTSLRGGGDLSQDGPRRQIEQNVLDFFNWGFVNAGNFFNVTVPSPGTTSPYDLSACFPVQKDGVADGRFWQAKKTDWCYESGVDSEAQPTVASGVYVGGVFHPTASTVGAYKHYLDFRQGRVVFDAPVPATAVVQVSYSFRTVSLYDQSVPWFKTVVLDGFLADQANRDRGGVLAVLDDYRVQPPLVVVEAAMSQGLRPVQLGDSAHWVDQAVLFHVVTQDKASRDNIADVITQQANSTIFLYDVNRRKSEDKFPLDWKGSPVPHALLYPDLVDDPARGGYRLKSLYFTSATPQDVSPSLPIFRGVVRAKLTAYFSPV